MNIQRIKALVEQYEQGLITKVAFVTSVLCETNVGLIEISEKLHGAIEGHEEVLQELMN